MADEVQSDFPVAWKPAAGDAITGTLERVEVIDPGGNGPYPCVTLKTSDGLRAIHAFHKVLRNELARRSPKVGDELTILYHGKKEGGSYGGYHSYAVAGGQVKEMDWDAWLPDEERQSFQQTPPPPVPTAEPPMAAAPVPAAAPAGEQFGEEAPF